MRVVMPKNTPLPEQLSIDGSTHQQILYDNSIELLKLAERSAADRGYYLCTSFGKDSIVIQRLCDEAGVKYEAHNSHTYIDPPELVQFGRNYYPDVIRDKPRMDIWALILKKGILPMRNIRYCCKVLKEDGGIGRTCVMGIRAEESNRRAKSWAPWTTRGHDKSELRMFDNDDIAKELHACVPRAKLTVNPIYYWDSAALWAFIHDRKMPYCSLYDEGFDRLGCIGCPMAREKARRAEFKRWPTYYKAFLTVSQKLLDSGRFPNMNSADALMEWWLSDNTQDNPVEGQEVLGDWDD